MSDDTPCTHEPEDHAAMSVTYLRHAAAYVIDAIQGNPVEGHESELCPGCLVSAMADLAAALIFDNGVEPEAFTELVERECEVLARTPETSRALQRLEALVGNRPDTDSYSDDEVESARAWATDEVYVTTPTNGDFALVATVHLGADPKIPPVTYEAFRPPTEDGSDPGAAIPLTEAEYLESLIDPTPVFNRLQESA